MYVIFITFFLLLLLTVNIQQSKDADEAAARALRKGKFPINAQPSPIKRIKEEGIDRRRSKRHKPIEVISVRLFMHV
jgi:hypothetical protein